MGKESFGQYQLLDVLGRGGTGQVFRAYDATTDPVVALKVLPRIWPKTPSFTNDFAARHA